MKVVLALILMVTVASASNLKQLRTTSPWCPVCKELVGQMEGTISKPETQELLVAEVKKLCELVFPHSDDLEKKCEMFVENAFVKALEYILSTLAPEKVCTLLKMCP